MENNGSYILIFFKPMMSSVVMVWTWYYRGDATAYWWRGRCLLCWRRAHLFHVRRAAPGLYYLWRSRLPLPMPFLCSIPYAPYFCPSLFLYLYLLISKAWFAVQAYSSCRSNLVAAPEHLEAQRIDAQPVVMQCLIVATA